MKNKRFLRGMATLNFWADDVAATRERRVSLMIRGAVLAIQAGSVTPSICQARALSTMPSPGFASPLQWRATWCSSALSTLKQAALNLKIDIPI
jgi:hypothetical protein